MVAAGVYRGNKGLALALGFSTIFYAVSKFVRPEIPANWNDERSVSVEYLMIISVKLVFRSDCVTNPAGM